MFLSRVRPLSTLNADRVSTTWLCVRVLAFAAMSAPGLAEVVTLPAAASIVGAAPFLSDVRAFNTSYANPLAVTARYRCFINCTAAGVPEIQFTLAPRESRAFDDMVNLTFEAPDTAGGVEFDFSGSSGQLVVTSRLYSTDPEPTVGMFIPGLPDSDAHPTTVLTSIRNLGSGPGFRTNVGVYNRGDSTASVTFRIFDGGVQVGNAVPVNVAGHSGAQVNRIFNIAGAATHATSNAIIVVNSNVQVFSYAAVIDNNTTDPIFVVGAEDQPPQAFTPVATNTPGEGNPTPTRTPTPPPSGTVRIVKVGAGAPRFSDTVEQGRTSHIQVGTTVRWEWDDDGFDHSTTSGPCPPCTGDGLWDSGVMSTGQFEYTFHTAGSFPYFCIPHIDMNMVGEVVVSP